MNRLDSYGDSYVYVSDSRLAKKTKNLLGCGPRSKTNFSAKYLILKFRLLADNP